MFRIRAHRYINQVGDLVTILRSSTCCQMLTTVKPIGGHSYYQEAAYQFKLRCRILIRDRLRSLHGKDYRKYEQPKMIWNSTISAYKRMKTISQPTGS